MKPIEEARARLDAAKAEHAEFMKHAGRVLEVGMKMKATMVERGLTAASDKCPKCEKSGALHGRLVVGQAAGRHRRSGSAFRMWCDNCADIRMME
jgi:hypothetical protein